ncbi:hypothetical protein WICMUC_003807 [Wickerhamomyces mucosus]|uniref:C2H2-type domain-containing protein n=1 Tax=Wickerhamomyces mucosus TaxID=1378264 RepID=A0A9P8TC13_9ASCO|nr:hypothetical protein WICMUC_003807 [Wickerhamomyces mucosus]
MSTNLLKMQSLDKNNLYQLVLQSFEMKQALENKNVSSKSSNCHYEPFIKTINPRELNPNIPSQPLKTCSFAQNIYLDLNDEELSSSDECNEFNIPQEFGKWNMLEEYKLSIQQWLEDTADIPLPTPSFEKENNECCLRRLTSTSSIPINEPKVEVQRRKSDQGVGLFSGWNATQVQKSTCECSTSTLISAGIFESKNCGSENFPKLNIRNSTSASDVKQTFGSYSIFGKSIETLEKEKEVEFIKSSSNIAQVSSSGNLIGFVNNSFNVRTSNNRLSAGQSNEYTDEEKLSNFTSDDTSLHQSLSSTSSCFSSPSSSPASISMIPSIPTPTSLASLPSSSGEVLPESKQLSPPSPIATFPPKQKHHFCSKKTAKDIEKSLVEKVKLLKAPQASSVCYSLEADSPFKVKPASKRGRSIRTNKSKKKQQSKQFRPLLPGELYYSCPQCPQFFRRPEHVKRHIRSLHTKVRPYVCKFCNKGFPRSDNLSQHLKTHMTLKEWEKLKDSKKRNGRH